ncbi:hypothetical protein ACFU3O_32385 [Streptomyces antibioticus]|uniref:hypothetical protein n=1 Tax=Streptomyces antibioticus TaxID=1890 RepID=UPI0036AB1553
MPPRSRDLAALRRFAEAHVAAHARAAAVHHDAACWCRRQQCALHDGTRVNCAGGVVLVLRHDPAVGQVWTLTEVCSACAPLMPHARVMSRAVPPPAAPREPYERPAADSGSGGPRLVPGGFSAPPGGTGQVPVPERRGGGGRRYGTARRRGGRTARGGAGA